MEQKESLKYQNVIHLRIPLKKEHGIEIIPGTHRRWDTKEEYDVRHSIHNKKPSDSLKNGKLMPLARKDLLVFLQT